MNKEPAACLGPGGPDGQAAQRVGANHHRITDRLRGAEEVVRTRGFRIPQGEVVTAAPSPPIQAPASSPPPSTSTSAAERLGHLEEVLGRRGTPLTEQCRAWAEIKASRLYEPEFRTWEDYCRQSWGLSRRHADRLEVVARVVEAFGPIGPVPQPTHESQVRPLANLAPELMRRVWQEAVQLAHGMPTAAQVREAKACLSRDARPRGEKPAALKSSSRRTTAAQRAKSPKPPLTLVKGGGPLSPREAQAAKLRGAGLSVKQIAQELDVGESTVKTMLQRVRQKLHAKNDIEAAVR